MRLRLLGRVILTLVNHCETWNCSKSIVVHCYHHLMTLIFIFTLYKIIDVLMTE